MNDDLPTRDEAITAAAVAAAIASGQPVNIIQVTEAAVDDLARRGWLRLREDPS